MGTEEKQKMSQAIKEAVEQDLKDFEDDVRKAFLIRLEMERHLSEL